MTREGKKGKQKLKDKKVEGKKKKGVQEKKKRKT